MLELVVFGATLAVAAGAFSVAGFRRLAAGRALERFASWRRLSFAPATREPGRRSARAFGTKDGAACAVDFCRIRGAPHTRVVADAVAGRLARVAIVRAGGTYCVHGLDPADSEALTSPRAGALQCLAARRDVRLACDGARVTLVWRGLEADPLVLDAALDLVVAVARLERPVAPYR